MMIGSGVSRWTMLHFGCAIVALLLAMLLLVTGYADPLGALRAPSMLIGVHLITIGWLSLLMLGALYQFVPVITNTTLYSQRLPIFGLGFIGAGLVLMLLGFLALGGIKTLHAGCLPIGGSLVLIGFVLGGTNIGLTLWKVRPLPLHAAFVAVSLVFLLVTALLGIAFALTFALPHPPAFLVQLTGGGVSLHMAAGLGGWFTLTVMGVSYRLLSMFMLAPDEPRRSTYAALFLTSGGLALLIIGGLVQLEGGPASFWVNVIGMAATGLGIAFYLSDIVEFYRTRRRKILELNSLTAAGALVLLTLAVLIGAGLALFGKLDQYAAAVGYLFVFGGLTGLGLSQLYKIIPFLTWLEVFGKKLGKGPVPRVQDLVKESRARPWFIAYFVTAAIASFALAFGHASYFRIVVAVQFLTTILIVVELWRARHPDPNLKPTLSRPAGSPLPFVKKPKAPKVPVAAVPVVAATTLSASHSTQGE
ncbi:MAG: hypothetical protein ABI351_07575 [Herbaspirillum sp.]